MLALRVMSASPKCPNSQKNANIITTITVVAPLALMASPQLEMYAASVPLDPLSPTEAVSALKLHLAYISTGNEAVNASGATTRKKKAINAGIEAKEKRSA
ncbi:hypothetical protein FACS189472_09210 [Alphaproteobacteria bacterium]|nr:hypothetical protein FACS189472_09210 [Alphaproteobacteria bacterium]